MFRFLLGRLAVLIPTFVGVSIIAFSFIRLLPGDPVALLSGERVMSPERHAEISHQLGFDRPIVIQYLDYLWGILHGDFGTSISTKGPVLDQFFELFPATLELSLCAIIFAVVLGIPAGVFAAIKRGSFFDQTDHGHGADRLFHADLLVGPAADHPVLRHAALDAGLRPHLADVLLPVGHRLHADRLAAVRRRRAPSSRRVSHLILPTIVLGTIPLAVIARQTRSAMLEVLSEDYVRTARAKGLSAFRVVGVHALRNAMIPVVTTIGLQVGVMLAGAILTETIFSWPGIGKWMVDSVFRRDYPVIQGGLLIIAGIIMLVNLVVDLLYGLINPRIRH